MSEIDFILAGLPLTEEQLFFILIIVILICRVIGRLIPDDATGFLGAVRRIAKVIGVSVENRVRGNVTETQITKAIIDEPMLRDAKGRFIKNIIK